MNSEEHLSQQDTQQQAGQLQDGELPEIISPITGEIIDPEDIDQLAEALESIKDFSKKISALRYDITKAISRKVKSQGKGKTSYLRGDKLRIKIEQPSDSWDQSALKRVREDHPEFADEYLRVEKVAVNARKYQQLDSESGTEAFENFKAELLAANRGKIDLPRVTVVRNDSANEE